MSRRAIAIRHVHFEDLGSFEDVLRKEGFDVRYFEAGQDDLSDIASIGPDLLVVLGGPIGAYEEAVYPFLRDEIGLLEQRITRDAATLGICLGGQLIARALGSRVYPGSRKEIGWTPLALTPAGRQSAVRHLEGSKTNMLHWHGDTFDLPAGARLLASTDACANQVFAYGSGILGFQCHPEAQAARLERWFIGHACEIAGIPGVNVATLRSGAQQFGPALERQASSCLAEWLRERPEAS